MEIRVLSSVEIITAIVDQIRCKLNVFNEDGVYRKDRSLEHRWDISDVSAEMVKEFRAKYKMK